MTAEHGGLHRYLEQSDNLFSVVCQVQTLFVLLAALLVLMRSQIVEATELIDKLHGPPMENSSADEQWFNQASCCARLACLLPLDMSCLHFSSVNAQADAPNPMVGSNKCG